MHQRRLETNENKANLLSKPKYRPDVDGLRAIAVGTVVAYHTGIPGFGGGFTGVDIFFVISGYLITGLLLLDIEQYQRVRMLQFYARRARRILPTLLLVVLTTVLISACFLSSALGEVQRVFHSAVATLAISANFYFLRGTESYFAIRSEFQPLLHTWSLSVEEQFYLVWPAALAATYALCAKTSNPTRWLGVAMGVLVIVSAACAVMFAAWHNPWAFYLTAARGWELGTGGLLAILLPSVRGVSRRAALTASVLGLALIAAGTAIISPDRFSPFLMAAFPVLGTSLVIFGNTVHPAGPIGRLLSTRPMVQVGLVSYGWYLWHWPALSIVRILSVGRHDLFRDCILSASMLALSFVTLWWYERPLRFRIGRDVPASWVVITGCGATVVAVALIFGVEAWSRQAPQTATEIAILRAKNDIPNQENCLLALGSNETIAPPACLASGKLKRLVLWGDSIADRLSPALQQWASQHGAAVAIERLTKPACPPLLNVLPTEPLKGAWKPYDGCRSFNGWVANRLSIAGATGSSGVLLSATWWPRATDFDLRQLGQPEPRHSFDINARTTEDSLKVLETAMRSTLREITDHGLRAVIVLQTPILLSTWGGTELDAPDCLFRKSELDCSMPLAVHNRLANPVNQILTRVAGEFSDVRIFDPIPVLCPEERCSARVKGIVAYTDFDHISMTMSGALTNVMAPYLDWLTADRPTAARSNGQRH
jgi:peptidoglycan/LPS O-acetylase OafA/YrhL